MRAIPHSCLGPCLGLSLLFFSPAVSTNDEPNSTTPTTTTTTAWQPEPNGRGTFSLIFSCLVTFTLCVWSALHLNVPAQNTSLSDRILEKTKWVLYGIFAPELVVATAAAQFIAARWLKREIEKDAKYRAAHPEQCKNMSSHTWTFSQCFYAVMGGFTADSPWVNFRSRTNDAGIESAFSSGTQVTITPEGIRLLSFLGRLPHIHKSQIEDKSKADWMAKSIICVQVGWMVIQVLGRAIKQMPISLLEINTCGHVACAIAIYLLWWSKPLDIQEPTLLDDEKDSGALSLMYLTSSISAVEGITDIRCFIHVATDADEHFCRNPFEINLDETTSSNVQDTSPGEAAAGENAEGEITTYLSIGSPGSRYPFSFLGFDDLRAGQDQFVALSPIFEQPETAATTTKTRTTTTRRTTEIPPPKSSDTYLNRAFRYRFNHKNPAISRDCRIYYSPRYTESSPRISLQHSHYCRRALLESSLGGCAHQQKQLPQHTPLPVELLRSASSAADTLREQCSGFRLSYRAYYFTYVPELGFFLGETEYILRSRIPNFPPLHNLSLGQVNIHRDRLRSVLALTAACYGALHCAATTSVESTTTAGVIIKFFPTEAERILWVISSLTIAVSGALLWGFYLARQVWPGFDRWVSASPGKLLPPGVHIEKKKEARRVKIGAAYAVLAVFALARVYLVVEAFVSLRKAPVALYDTPGWTDFLPHL